VGCLLHSVPFPHSIQAPFQRFPKWQRFGPAGPRVPFYWPGVCSKNECLPVKSLDIGIHNSLVSPRLLLLDAPPADTNQVTLQGKKVSCGGAVLSHSVLGNFSLSGEDPALRASNEGAPPFPGFHLTELADWALQPFGSAGELTLSELRLEPKG
jgi:hypothetical protein